MAAIANLLAGGAPRVRPPDDLMTLPPSRYQAPMERSPRTLSHAASQYESQPDPGAAWEVRPRPPQSDLSQAPNQMAIRQAQRAASQARKEVENLQGELALVRERLQRNEQTQLTKTLAFSRQVALAEAQADSLRHELAAAVAINHKLEARMPLGKAPLWLGAGALLSAAVVCAVLLPRTNSQQSPAPKTVTESTRAYGAPAKFATSIPNGSVEQALNRLDKAMSGISPREAEGVLGEANRRLKASGLPPCATTIAGGKASLLLSSGAKDHQGPLAESLARCAEAVEQVVR
jgi:hypothetical protein